MFKYEITKKGRKWYHAITADERKYKAQIEINENSKDWEVGQVVEFEGEFVREVSGRFTKVFIYPKTAEQKERELKIQKVEKWLQYIEEKSGEYLYQRGVDELRGLPMTDEQKERFRIAKKEGQTNGLRRKIRDYFGYIEDSMDKNSWYQNGENKIRIWVDDLKDLGVESDYIEELEKLKEKFYENKERIDKENAIRYFTVQKLEEWGGYRVGEIIRAKDGRIGKIVKTWRYYEEDTMSFGYMVDGGWLANAKCDTQITDTERDAFLQEEEEEKRREEEEKKEREKRAAYKAIVWDLSRYIIKNGTYPQGQHNVHGEDIYNDINIYGGGSRICIVEEKIWNISNNGMDGDNWSHNNVMTGGAGAIGHYMEIDDKCKEYIAKIKEYNENNNKS